MTYADLIPSANNQQPKFMATVNLLTGVLAETAATTLSLPQAFDVDTAVGEQLDMVGEWVGFPRRVFVPLIGVFFSWNTTGLGWNEGSWKGPFETGDGTVLLDDTTYRTFLRIQILANYWHGDQGSPIAWAQGPVLSYFGATVALLDNQDMTATLYVSGTPNAVVNALINQGFFPPRPLGVTVI